MEPGINPLLPSSACTPCSQPRGSIRVHPGGQVRGRVSPASAGNPQYEHQTHHRQVSPGDQSNPVSAPLTASESASRLRGSIHDNGDNEHLRHISPACAWINPTTSRNQAHEAKASPACAGSILGKLHGGWSGLVIGCGMLAHGIWAGLTLSLSTWGGGRSSTAPGGWTKVGLVAGVLKHARRSALNL